MVATTDVLEKPIQARSWIAYLFLATTALQIAAKVAEEVALSGLVADAARVWRQLTHVLWGDFFAWLEHWITLAPTPSEMDGLTLSVLLGGAAISAFIRRVIWQAQRRASLDGAIVTRSDATKFGLCLTALYLLFAWPRFQSFLADKDLPLVIGLLSLCGLFVVAVFNSSQMICYSRPLLMERDKSTGSWVRLLVVFGYFGFMLWSGAKVAFGDSAFAAVVATFFALSVFTLSLVRPEALWSMCVAAAVVLLAAFITDALTPAVVYLRQAIDAAST